MNVHWPNCLMSLVYMDGMDGLQGALNIAKNSKLCNYIVQWKCVSIDALPAFIGLKKSFCHNQSRLSLCQASKCCTCISGEKKLTNNCLVKHFTNAYVSVHAHLYKWKDGNTCPDWWLTDTHRQTDWGVLCTRLCVPLVKVCSFCYATLHLCNGAQGLLMVHQAPTWCTRWPHISIQL